MIRLFNQHNIRPVEELDGIWELTIEGSDKIYQMPVPGCWEQHPDLTCYRGKGLYKRKIFIKDSGNFRLEFKGISHTGDVFFDNKKIAHHHNAFTPFSVVVENVTAGMHEIAIEIDNSFGEHSALHVPNDYYTYGGITRPVALEKIEQVYIKRLWFTPVWSEDGWQAKVDIWLENLSEDEQYVELRAAINEITGKKVSDIVSYADVAGNSEQKITLNWACSEIKAWSHLTPELYFIETVLFINGKPIDDMIDRVGFRRVEISENEIKINGSPVFLKGVNRHEDYAEVGCAIPFQLMARDMDIMQDLGVNALRTCHYPNDERFLDLCDERGIMVWEENHARGFDLARMENPNFDGQCEDCIREMIENHYNHPAIIIWGILNECASETTVGRQKYARQYDQIRSMDKTRPVTSATCKHFEDICLDLPDIVSTNLYPRWYLDESVAECCKKEIEWIKTAGGEHKPIIISEFGAGAIYGFRDRTRCKWSEELQADILKESLQVYMTDENVSGVFIWQYADCRVTEEEWFHARPKCHNNKGIVDEYRRPKLAYDIVKEAYKKKG